MPSASTIRPQNQWKKFSTARARCTDQTKLLHEAYPSEFLRDLIWFGLESVNFAPVLPQISPFPRLGVEKCSKWFKVREFHCIAQHFPVPPDPLVNHHLLCAFFLNGGDRAGPPSIDVVEPSDERPECQQNHPSFHQDGSSKAEQGHEDVAHDHTSDGW